ncbi:hypothetical protein H696_01303 [Fonticula alba]|uniref:AAA+ ATPase domain-containing protein n=1 Tax=Fonticula alba TaxID=691883 RepID=A0A058ZBX0_FONAL|nr:hypothetical protein H696_01303 [Fonticula alba]KCV71894.1 hypothetical protein H696_01303 [Fonticula alba]|eukprot:XP_009493472.1 hypothetical protein H696_01303 [Fonticula alba]
MSQTPATGSPSSGSDAPPKPPSMIASTLAKRISSLGPDVHDLIRLRVIHTPDGQRRAPADATQRMYDHVVKDLNVFKNFRPATVMQELGKAIDYMERLEVYGSQNPLEDTPVTALFTWKLTADTSSPEEDMSSLEADDTPLADSASSSEPAKRPRETAAPDAEQPTGTTPADGTPSRDDAQPTPKKRLKRRPAPGQTGSARDMGGLPGPDGAPASVPMSFLSERPTLRFSDIGGIDQNLQRVREFIEFPLRFGSLYAHLGGSPASGLLLHGPPGCGKTMLAHAIGGEFDVPFFRVSAPEMISGVSGESEQRLRSLFAEARRMAPCIVFIDEIDAIAPKRNQAAREMERRIVAQLLTCMDEVERYWKESNGKYVCIIGATNRPDSIDAALRRSGRFDREISVGIPNDEARESILRAMARNMTIEPGALDCVARDTPGFVGADLQALLKEAVQAAVSRIVDRVSKEAAPAPAPVDTVTEAAAAAAAAAAAEDPSTGKMAEPVVDSTIAETPDTRDAPIDGVIEEAITAALTGAPLVPGERDWSQEQITSADFMVARKLVQPSSTREGFATIPNVTWSDVGALEGVRRDLHMSIIAPIRHPEKFRALRCSTPSGVLLYGPPGCGKTLVAKAVANESRANFISVKGPELLNKYVGESERAVRALFARAGASAPCVIFFDELDALAPSRSGNEGGSGNAATERVVNQLLTEMDGVDRRNGVFVIGATNRPDIIDPAVMRPGRLGKLIYVGLPSAVERQRILQTHLRNVPLATEPPSEVVSVSALADLCDGFTGADLASLVQEAAMLAVQESIAADDPHLAGLLRRLEGDVASAEGASAGATAAEEGVATEDVAPAPPAVPHTPVLQMRHFVASLAKVRRSVTPADQKRYEAMYKKYCQ